MIMFTKKFLINTAERVLMTMAQTAAAVYGVDQVSAFEADWKYLAGVTLSAGFICLLKCLGSRKVGNPDDGGVTPA